MAVVGGVLAVLAAYAIVVVHATATASTTSFVATTPAAHAADAALPRQVTSPTGSATTVTAGARPDTPTAAAAVTLEVVVNRTTGAYTVAVAGAVWMQSESTGIFVNNAWYLASPPNASYNQLELVDVRDVASSDAWGTYTATAMDWLAGNTSFSSLFKQYTLRPTLVVFEQVFPDGASGTSLGTSYETMDVPMAMFPRFSTTAARMSELGYYTILDQWEMDMTGLGLDGVAGGLYAGTPLLLYDRETLVSVVMSPANHFKSGVQGRPAEFNSDLACGVQGRVRSLPRRFRFQTMLYASTGINGAMVEWGDLLLGRYGKARYDPTALDPQRSFLGYHTPTGGYYWYNTVPGLDYEQTMLALQAAHQAAGIPVRLYQLDSWFYYKQANGANSTDMWGGIWQYEPMPSVFPSGMASVQAQLGTPLMTHSKYFASTTVYASQAPFLMDAVRSDTDAAVPLTTDTWDEIMSMVADWGVILLKQDWLESVYEFLEAASFDTTSARNNLVFLAASVARAGMTLQLCMPLVSDIVASVECPAARSMRISDDYGDPTQWRIGQNSIYAWALGLAPFKDVFWSQSVMPGNPYGDVEEPNPELQAVVSVLSTAGVGFGDGIGFSNVSLLARTCAADGTILGPAKPATVIDAWFRSTGGPAGGEVWHTYAQLPVVASDAGPNDAPQAPLIVHYMFAVNLTEAYAFKTSDAYLAASVGRPAPDPFQYWSFGVHAPDQITAFSASQPVLLPPCPAAPDGGSGVIPYFLFAAAQRLQNGWALLGETGKFVPVSSQRFGTVTISSTGNRDNAAVAVVVNGAAGEQVTVRFAASDGTVVAVPCQFPGTAPAWWGNQTTSMNHALVAYCTGAKQCACGSTAPPAPPSSPSPLASWALVLIGFGAAVVLGGSGIAIIWHCGGRKRPGAHAERTAGEAAPLLAGASPT